MNRDSPPTNVKHPSAPEPRRGDCAAAFFLTMNPDRTQEVLEGFEGRIAGLESALQIRESPKQGPRIPAALLSSDCRNRNHRKCRGYAQPRILRYQRIRCPCPCHEPSLLMVEVPDE